MWSAVLQVLVICFAGIGVLRRTSAASQNDTLDRFFVSLRENLDSGTADLLSRFSGGTQASRSWETDQRVPWYSRATRDDDDTIAREVLEVTFVRRDEEFIKGVGVQKWLSVDVGSTTYIVGLRPTGVTLVTALLIAPDVGSGRTFKLLERKWETYGTLSAASLFKYWNPETKIMEAILVLAIDSPVGDLHWYRLGSGEPEKIRSWPVHKKIALVKAFKVGNNFKLLLIAECADPGKSPCDATLDIFDFNLSSFDPTLSQTLPLGGVAAAVEVGAMGEDVYLAVAVPQAGVVKLFRYQRPNEVAFAGSSGPICCGSFEFWRDVISPRVTHAVFFHVGYKMYLAVGGAEPAILRFISPTQTEGCSKALQNLGFVSTWIVLPVDTYRDEVLLLAEVTFAEGLVLKKTVMFFSWGGVGVFRLQPHPACLSESQNSALYGSCLLEDGSSSGLGGTVALQLGDAAVVTILMPRDSKPSALFRVHTQLQPILNPLLWEVSMLNEEQRKLELELFQQDIELSETEAMLHDTLALDGANIITANWGIQEVYTPRHDYLIDETILDVGQPVNLTELETASRLLDDYIQHLLEEASDAAVPDGISLSLNGPQTLLGGVEIVGTVHLDSLNVSQLNGEYVSTILIDTVRSDRLKKIGGVKTLLAVEAGDIDFASLNNIPKDELIFDTPHKPIVVDGKIVVSELLHVLGDVELPPNTGTVNDLDLSEEVFQLGKSFGGKPHLHHVTIQGDLTVDMVNTYEMHPYSLRRIVMGNDGYSLGENEARYDTLTVKGHLQVERVNGILWNDILKRIVWKDSDDHIEGLTTVYGTLRSDQGMNVWQLNNLSFPGDFVLHSENSVHVSGRKTLHGPLFVADADITNSVNGVPVKSLITLSTDQNLDGVLTLNEADIYGDTKVDFGINGISLEQIHTRSPLVDEGEVVTSNVLFSELEVQGKVVVSSAVDGLVLKDFLEDIVRYDSLHDVITGKKILSAGLSAKGPDGLTVASGMLNEIRIADLARVDIPQKFTGVTAIEKATFGELHLTGAWDGVNVVELNADAMRLNGNQDSSAILLFADDSELMASQLVISQQLNTELAAAAIRKVTGNVCDVSSPDNCVITGPVSADVVKVAGNVIVDRKMCGWDLNEFETRRLSRSRPQTVEGTIAFGTLEIVKHLEVKFINQLPLHMLIASVPSHTSEDLMQLVLSGRCAVDDLYIEGRVTTKTGVNGINLAYIAENSVKLHGDNVFTANLQFSDVVNIGDLQVLGSVEGRHPDYLIKDLILKSEDVSTINGVKIFVGGLDITETLVTSYLSGLSPSNIVTKSSAIHMQGPLRVAGNVHAANVSMKGLLNKIPVQHFQNRYRLISEGRHKLIGNGYFGGGSSVDDLFVIGKINDIQIDEFFKSIVSKTDFARITGNKLFINKVTFQNVSVRGLVNNIPLLELAHDIIFDDNEPAIVDGQITFTKELTAIDGVSLSGNLEANELDGCMIKEWFNNAIYLDQSTDVGGLKKLSDTSAYSDIKLSVLNFIDMSKVITLHQRQDIPTSVHILAAGVEHDLTVLNSVNGKNLQSEYDNTLLVTGNQRLSGQKTFLNGFTVEGNVVTNGSIDGRDLRNSVTLDTIQTIKGPLKFERIEITSGLRVAGGLVSDIDVTKWNQRAFLKRSLNPQVISGTWNVLGHVKFMTDVEGNGLLDGEDVHQLAREIQRAESDAQEMQNQIKLDWIHLCDDTNALLEKARAQPFLYQQLEVVQALLSTQRISSMHAFGVGHEQYLVVSFSNSCSGAVYRWNVDRTSWDLVDAAHQNVGGVEKWATFQSGNVTYLATSSDVMNASCPYSGGNVWRFGPGFQLRNVHSMEPWREAQVDESHGHLYTIGRSGVNGWQIEDGVVKRIDSWSVEHIDGARFVPRGAGLGISVSDGQSLTILNGPSAPPLPHPVNRIFPASDRGSVAVMEVSNGRKVVAVAESDADVLIVYENVQSGRVLGSVHARRAHSLSVLELTGQGRQGQTLLAFIEDERLLRVVEYKGVEGLVDVAEAQLAVSIKEMIPIRLKARGLVNYRNFLLLRSDYQVLLLEVEMAGDPLDEPELNCHL